MPLPRLKYNPGLRGDEELIRSFVVRQTELALILETIRENTGSSNQHLLVVGPRGSGKTTLVRRVAAELRSEPDFKGWYPLVFAEESYLVTSAGELWLEALFHLGEQTQDERWRGAYEELRQGQDETQLLDRALAKLMDFADENECRILLVVENLNMLLGQQMRGSSDWNLRHTLQNEPRIMLLGTATNRFDEIDSVNNAWFELLAIRNLRPLDLEECRALWKVVAGADLAERRSRPIQILTGGNPRLLTIMGEFAAGRSFRDLMSQLVQLVDNHTEYFKSYLDGLAPAERKIFVAMLDIWDPASAGDIAEKTRMRANKASSLLGRLVNRGAVSVFKSEGRKKYYQVTERLYNVYYLMRRRAHPASRVEAAIRFMINFYDEEKLVSATARLAAEACGLPAAQREDHHWAYRELVMLAPGFRLKKKIIDATPEDFFQPYEDSTGSLQIIQALWLVGRLAEAVSATKVGEMIAVALSLEPGDREAKAAAQKATELEPKNPWAWFVSGLTSFALSEETEAEEAVRRALDLIRDAPEPVPAELAAACWHIWGELLQRKDAELEAVEKAYRKSIELSPNMPGAWLSLGQLFHRKLGRHAEAESAYRKVVKYVPDFHHVWAQLGVLLHEELGRYEEAEQAYREAVRFNPDSVWVWTRLGSLLQFDLSKYEEAETAYRQAIKIDPTDSVAWLELSGLLGKVDRHEEARQALRGVIEIDPELALAWTRLGWTEKQLGQDEKAESAYRKAVELEPEDFYAWCSLGELSLKRSQFEEAEQAFSSALSLNSNDANLWNHLGALEMSRSRVEQAEDAFQRALEIDPEMLEAWMNLATSFGVRGHYPEAVKALESALELDPDSQEVLGLLEMAWGHLAQNLIDAKRYEEAETALQKGIDVGGKYVGGFWTNLGLVYQRQSRFEEARQAQKKAIEADPEQPASWVNLGLANRLTSRFDEAIKAFEKAIELDSQMGEPWTYLAELLHSQQRYGEAEDAYLKAIDLADASDELWPELFRLRLERGDVPTDVMESIRSYLGKEKVGAQGSKRLARTVRKAAPCEYLPEAETWVRKALEIEGDAWELTYELCAILGAQGDWTEALERSGVVIDAAPHEDLAVHAAAELLIDAAAAGHAEEALRVLTASAGRPAFEALTVGLRTFLGETPKIAQEIAEVAQDVVELIQEKSAKCRSSKEKA